ncbi:uncharacterized protein LOC119667552 [Teleopsis dalmanni]|uniref:uncharacterized protein LOC119667552 n=1 Tax=Teleopsis dalmanni TaxID=139649 RepID=UPI0018CE8E6C|nr:uncharacterized protein LOC119667552 [Teleopsis dalmanni]
MDKSKIENLIDLSDVQNLENESTPANNIAFEPVCLLSSQCLERRESFDNNPFDHAQKLARRLDDPFEIVEKEACMKARNSILTNAEVKMGKLLSLSDDNLLDDDDADADDMGKKANKCRNFLHFSDEINSPDSTCTQIASSTPNQNVENSSDTASSAESNKNARKNKKYLDQRKRLLKYSLTNSTSTTPVSHKENSDQLENKNSDSHFTAALNKAAKSCEMIFTESPLKFVDDLMFEEPPNLIDSEKDFEADLEMLQIPMLSQLPSPAKVSDLPIIESARLIKPQISPDTSVHGDIETIRKKLKATHGDDADKEQDITKLIQDLKKVISNSNDVDEQKKSEVNMLLETLRGTWTSDKNDLKPAKEEKDTSIGFSAPPLKRQGTFDMEVEQSLNSIKNDDSTNTDNNIYMPSGKVMQEHVRPPQPIPDIMINSSGTFDGETSDEKRDLFLPEVDPLYPSTHSSPAQSDISDLLEQLGKVLGNQLALSDDSGNASNGNVGAAAINPTFIVVMNTPQTNMQELSPGAVKTRRRSQSLSLHDKIKVLQIPMQTAVPVINNQLSPTTPDSVGFKTPTRMRARRNSYSSGTPHTPLNTVNDRRKSCVSDTITKITNNLRTPQRLETHHETQPKVMINPMPQCNMFAYKPDLKKKPKPGISSGSIMKSNVPLKATIPVKKVAPMLKPSPPGTMANSKHNLNSSIQFLNKPGKPSHTSTPMSTTTTALNTSPRYLDKPR